MKKNAPNDPKSLRDTEEFKKQFKEENPDNKSVAAVGKADGANWKSMSNYVCFPLWLWEQIRVKILMTCMMTCLRNLGKLFTKAVTKNLLPQRWMMMLNAWLLLWH